VLAILAVPFAVATLQPYGSTIEPLPPAVQTQLKATRAWQPGCPVPLSGLRLLTVTHWGFDGRPHEGELIVDKDVAAPLARVFRKLYALRFAIRHMRLADLYGSAPADGDVSGSFECREAVPSPCTGGSGTGTWSNHAYGDAIDLNPRENPYVGCGTTRDRRRSAYIDRSRLRKGMVTPAVVRAFRAIGWGWGGDWSGRTRDYMHFSTTGG
jgi:hypothetical protein